jgi:HKD family nuclease
MPSGLDRLEPHLREFLGKRGRLRLLTGDYLGVTEPEALARLLDIEGDRRIRVFETTRPPVPEHPGPSPELVFHPKAYIFERADGTGVAFVGSSNLSQSALLTGIEWNYRAVSKADAGPFQEIRAAFDRLFDHPATRELTREWIDAYRRRRPAREAARMTAPIEVPDEPATIPVPHAIRQEALETLEATRAQGNAAGLVLRATGLESAVPRHLPEDPAPRPPLRPRPGRQAGPPLPLPLLRRPGRGTQSRARNAYEQLQKRGGTRTSWPRPSAPRAQSPDELSEGNEGLDLPELDTVLMLRPTESRIPWLQQFGRGLRKTKDDKKLTVIDSIGNHRTFLLKPQTLFSLKTGDQEILNLLERAREGPIEIAPGCSVTYELETIDIRKRRGLQALPRGVPGAPRGPPARRRGLPRGLQPEGGPSRSRELARLRREPGSSKARP